MVWMIKYLPVVGISAVFLHHIFNLGYAKAMWCVTKLCQIFWHNFFAARLKMPAWQLLRRYCSLQDEHDLFSGILRRSNHVGCRIFAKLGRED
ncbi:hypothetical protein F5B20DRAFT_534181 [Whalleya microplaca]|nr:hypothetical protein F5B20DRAFT_534181 [Whalleya microplaca]